MDDLLKCCRPPRRWAACCVAASLLAPTPGCELFGTSEPAEPATESTPAAEAVALPADPALAGTNAAATADDAAALQTDPLAVLTPIDGNKRSSLTPAELQQAVRNFADQYRQIIASACDAIVIAADDDPDLRRRAQQTKIDGATAMYDIAIDPVPASALINATVLVSLQLNFLRVHGEDFFGEHAPQLVQRAEYLQQEAFRICGGLMSDEKREALLNNINQWSQMNPGVTNFWYIRLDDLPGIDQNLSANDLLNSVTGLPTRFFNVFNPFAKGQDSVADAQLLAERMSWLAPRLMILAQWRAEAVVYDSIANTRLPEALDLGDRFATVAENLPDTLDQQRTALFADLEANRETIGDLLGQTESLTANTNKLLKTADQITGRIQEMQSSAAANADPNAPPGRPFDITEYTAALDELHNVVVDANALLLNANDATAGDALEVRLDAVQATGRNLILLAAFATLAVGLLIVLAAKFIPSRRRAAA